MMSKALIGNLRVLWRTERIIADIKLRHLLSRLGLQALAGLIAMFGVMMLEFAGYSALVQTWSAIAAATILGLVNFAITAAILGIIAKMNPGQELELATDVQKAAMHNLQDEVCAIQVQHAELGYHPLATLLPVLLPPLINLLTQKLKKGSEKTETKSEKTSSST